jgi:alkylation response protein AidB-like acyl-CoA dehydrogenase
MSDIVTIATRLADEFRTRAADYDRTGEFPTKNYDAMREAGYLRALVPEDLGGMGVSLAEMARAQQALARGCGSTALAVNMHQFQVGAMADAYRGGGPTAPMLKRVAEEGVVLGSTGAEAIVAGEWSPSTTADPDGEDYIVTGRKFFCSQAPGMDFVRVNARDTKTDEMLVISISAKAPGVSVVETWDTTGMRATASHDLVLEKVRVPATVVGARMPAGKPMDSGPYLNVSRWFLPLMSSVYLGIAEEARVEAYRSLGGGINSTHRAEALTDVLVGQMEAEFLTAAAVRDSVAAQVDSPPADMQRAVATAVLGKEIVTARAVAVVDIAVQIAGGRAFYRKSPLERLARDVRAGRFHPPAAPVSFQIAGERFRAAEGASAPTASRNGATAKV